MCSLFRIELHNELYFPGLKHPWSTVLPNICFNSTGLPGDRIPPYILNTLPCDGWSHQNGKVPKGKMWVEGDNIWDPNKFKDSRSYGAVPIGLIEGVVFCRLWPIYTNKEKLCDSGDNR